MSIYLWKYYLENDLEKFQELLATAIYSSAQPRPSYAGSLSSATVDTPSKALASSPLSKAKGRPVKGGRTSTAITLTRADINSKDAYGVTLLHSMASSRVENATSFGLAFLKVRMLDLYVQDLESGWTALHRALYNGKISLARAIMERDMKDLHEFGGTGHAGGLIKIKDHEGNSPFDVYATTIASRIIPHVPKQPVLGSVENESEDDDDDGQSNGNGNYNNKRQQGREAYNVDGDELFAFGSNKNLTLGFGDEDDRQFPERVYIRRPQSLKDVFYRTHVSQLSRAPSARISEEGESAVSQKMPAVVEFKPIKIQEVQLSKLHSAIITTDPESNLFMCGYGKGGRLGTGDEGTRFQFTNVHGGGLQKQKIAAVALGQNHTIAVTNNGEVFTWGSNKFGQLGYTLANQTSTDTDPMQLYPRQLFGLLKREFVVGCAASQTHSVVFSTNSLFTFGKHDGQLGLIDSDARSLDMQITPRKVAASLFSSPIIMATAIDKATSCLLENYDVWIFANYGYAKITFPLGEFSNHFLRGSFSSTHYDKPNHITKICSGGDTICALAREGDVYTVNVSQKIDPAASSSSTTNPTKIKGALSAPQRIWSLRKEHMAVRDVDVGQDGSIVICTQAGSVWRRVKRAKLKVENGLIGASEYKQKDYKFSRIPGLTRIAAVRSNAFGGYAAIRTDCDVLKTQIEVDNRSLWRDILPLLSFKNICPHTAQNSSGEAFEISLVSPATIKKSILMSKDIESDLASVLLNQHATSDLKFDVTIGSTASEIRIPCHQFLLTARSTIMRHGFSYFRKNYYFELAETFLIEYDTEGNPSVILQGADVLTMVNFVLYLYTDTIVSFWNFTRQRPQFAARYREVRIELMKLAGQLDMRSLEHAARLMTEPVGILHKNLDNAILDPEFMKSGDIEVQLADGQVQVHAALMCQRCPFFEGLFHGRAGGSWLLSRRSKVSEPQDLTSVDLKHVNSTCFNFVVRYLYADVGEELFEEAAASDLDSFLDFVLDVMAVANELMLDRLAAVCQKIVGSYVNTRNVCWLLNAIAPCSVTEFKDAALEYICLNLEGMLENSLLDELDEDLLAELDSVVISNQLARLPIAKSGRAEEELLEKHPELIELMQKAKQIKIDSMSLQSRFHEDEVRMTKVKVAVTETMFSMDEDDLEMNVNPKPDDNTPTVTHEMPIIDPWATSRSASLSKDEIWFDAKGKQLSPASASIQGRVLSAMASSSPNDPREPSSPEAMHISRKDSDSSPWADATFSTSKLSMKQIMEQATEGRQSNISSGLSKSASPAPSLPISVAKVSQKERKRLYQQQQQQQLQKALDAAQGTSEALATPTKPSPWQVISPGPKISIKDDFLETTTPEAKVGSSKRRASPGGPLTMRQTIPGNARQTSNPSTPTRSPLPRRSVSSPFVSPSPQVTQTKHELLVSSSAHQPKTRSPKLTSTSSSPTIPRSVRHDAGRKAVEPSLQISISDILMQQQIEKDLIKEATAKRSLLEIQEEQAFQEWWDQEEAATKARMQQEEAAATAKASGAKSGRRGKMVRGRGRGRGGVSDGGSRVRGKGKSTENTISSTSKEASGDKVKGK